MNFFDAEETDRCRFCTKLLCEFATMEFGVATGFFSLLVGYSIVEFAFL